MQTPRWFVPLLPVSNVCCRVQHSEENFECWKIEVKSSRAAFSYWIFEHNMTVYEGQVFLTETRQCPKRQRCFEKQISLADLNCGNTSSCPLTMLIGKYCRSLCSVHPCYFWPIIFIERHALYVYWQNVILLLVHFLLLKTQERKNLKLQRSQNH